MSDKKKGTVSYAFSMGGALLASAAGAMMGAGFGLLKDPSDRVDVIQKRAMGGSALLVGFYLFSPTCLREIWNKGCR